MFISCGPDKRQPDKNPDAPAVPGTEEGTGSADEYKPVWSLQLLPEHPRPGSPFRIVATGGKEIDRARIEISGPADDTEARAGRSGNEFPYWRVYEFAGRVEGKYTATLTLKGKRLSELEFQIDAAGRRPACTTAWKTIRSWDPSAETLFSAWVNALFQGCTEQSSWNALHEVTRDSSRNFLYNHLSLGEDDPLSKHGVVMQPDCADNPFFLRAYFAWKFGLPFAYHICNRGSLNQAPRTGQYITNEIQSSAQNPVEAFNIFLRRLKDGVHSGTARTALDDESSDYYPLALSRKNLIPGTVYADPYGHTLTLVSLTPQAKDSPGLLLSVDAQPDGTIAIKRFWKGNFLFTTSGVVGEPGFKAFRPIEYADNKTKAVTNRSLSDDSGFRAFSLEQRRMDAVTFYSRMERIINPEPLDAEAALLDLINALHEQLIVRVGSVDNAEKYFRQNPGAVIPMPSTASGIFLALGQWENFSTPNRDLRLLIAIDAVAGFPEAASAPGGLYRMKGSSSAEEKREMLESLLRRKASELSIKYTKSDGSPQKLTIAQVLERRASFEIAYNPNDGPEIRWGAPGNSAERATCRRHAPASQSEKMLAARQWFSKRLHPPT